MPQCIEWSCFYTTRSIWIWAGVTLPIFCVSIERFHSRDQRPYWFNETKESICIKIEFNSQKVSLVHQYGRRSFVLVHQHGRRDVMWKRSIEGSCSNVSDGVPDITRAVDWIYLHYDLVSRQGNNVGNDVLSTATLSISYAFWKEPQRLTWHPVNKHQINSSRICATDGRNNMHPRYERSRCCSLFDYRRSMNLGDPPIAPGFLKRKITL